MKKRILSMLLAIVMVVTLLPTVAFAEGTSDQAQWGVAQGTSVPATWEDSGTLAEALTYAKRLTDGTAYIQLLNSVKTESYVDIETGMSAVLDLNGHDIDRGLTGMQNSGFVIYTKGNLTLCDTSAEGQGKITGGYANSSTFGSGVYVYNGGSFTMLSGNITGNTAYQNGGSGVRVDNGATFTMYGGNIYGNTCTYTGGTVNVCGTMYLYGGNIYDNSACYATGIYVMEDGRLEMSGGTVGSSDPAKGNVATNEGGTCGVSTNGVFTMTGGSIINNIGVGVFVGSGGTFNVSGTVNISGNKMGAAECNIQLAKDKTITVAGPLNCTTPIGVVGKKDQVITSGWRTYMGAADLDAYFESDTSNLYLDVNTNGEVFFTETQPPVKYTVTAAEAVADKITLSHTKAAKDTTVTVSSVLTDPNIVLTSVICTAYDGTEVATTANNGGFEFSMPECDVTVTATFETLYPVWVGGVQITSENKGNLIQAINDANNATIASGGISYDPDSKTLTLDNFSYTGAGYLYDEWYDMCYYAAIYALEDLNVVLIGDNTITCTAAEEDYCTGISCDAALTISDNTAGTLTVNANEGVYGSSVIIDGTTVDISNSYYGICGRSLTIADSVVNVNSNDTGIDAGSITIESSIVDVFGTEEAMTCEPTLEDPHKVYAGVGTAGLYEYTEGEREDWIYEMPHVQILKKNSGYYPVWIGAEQFTDDNLTINGTTGTATYAPTTKTLTLNNFSYTGEGALSDGMERACYYAVITSSEETLNIVLQGENSITCTGNGEHNYFFGINATNLTISDDTGDASVGALKVTGDASSVWVNSLEIEGCIVEMSGGDYAIAANDVPTLTGDFLVYAGTAEEHELITSPEDETYANKYVKIVPIQIYDVWVGGEQFTSEKLSIEGDSGTATYDPESKTLTLNNFSYTGAGYQTEYYSAAICALDNLNIKLVGTNNITCQSNDTSVNCRAISVWYGKDPNTTGHLTITGTDKTSDKLICTANDGIIAVRSVTVDSATIQMNDGAIESVVSDVTINNSIVAAAEVNGGHVTVENSKIETENELVATNDLTITNSTVTGGSLAAWDDASVTTITASQINVTGISACVLYVENQSSVTAELVMGKAIFFENSTVRVTGAELLEDGKTYAIIIGEGGIAISNSTVGAYGSEGACLRMQDSFTTFVPVAPVYFVGEQIVTDDGYMVTAGADKASATEVADPTAETYASKYVRIVPAYTVTYMVGEDEVYTEKVEPGKDVVHVPEVPAKEGYTGKWDHDGKNITADTEINAVYTVKKYTVTYKADGKVVKTVEVEHGKDATAPEIPAKEGYNETAPKWDKDGKNITADTEINAVYTKNQPGEYADVTPDTNVGGGKVAEEIEELKEKVPFTQEEEKQIEHGADVEVWLEIKDISASVSSEEKAKVEEKLGDADVALYLDIAMFKQVGENEASRLTQLSDKVQITFKLDDSYINTDKDVTRTYSIIHVHDGKAEVITPVFDANAKTLSFQTDRFSTYALVYTDVVNTPPTEETVPPTEETVPPTEKPAPPADTPATGDSFQPAFWIACMTLSIFGIAVLLLNAKRRHAR